MNRVTFPHFFCATYIPSSVYVTLRRCLGSEPLLPNLQTLEWAQLPYDKDINIAFFHLMLGPQLSTLTLGFSLIGEEFGRELASALSNFGQNPNQLRSILISSVACPVLEEAILALGLRQRNLTEFNYSWGKDMSLATVSHLSRLNNLQHVSLRITRQIYREILDSTKVEGDLFFPSLQLFTLQTEALDICDRWLHAIRHTRLNSLTLIVDEPPKSQVFSEFLVKLVKHPTSKTLRQFHFEATRPSPRQDTGQHLFTPEKLAPLINLQLTSVKLELGGPLYIDNDFVERMALAWPGLRTLELNAWWRRYPLEPFGVTLLGLIPLARHCPDIYTLAIPIDMDVSDFQKTYEGGNRPTGGVSFNQCCMVGIGASILPPTEAEHLLVAGFLSDLCPDLVVLQTAWMKDGEPGPDERHMLDAEDEDQREGWRLTWMYAKEMARVRKQERLWKE